MLLNQKTRMLLTATWGVQTVLSEKGCVAKKACPQKEAEK
jgi:hypothetical protein